MTVTTKEGFDTVAQAGSDDVWSGISNMVYPTEGEGSVNIVPYWTLFGYIGRSNTLSLSVPQEASGIPTGAAFVSMEIFFNLKKTGHSSAKPNWSCRTSLSSGHVFTILQTTDGSYEASSRSGDESYWKLGAHSDTEIIDALRDGSLSFDWFVHYTGSNVSTLAKMKEVTITITYDTTAGDRGSVIAALV